MTLLVRRCLTVVIPSERSERRIPAGGARNAAILDDHRQRGMPDGDPSRRAGALRAG